MSDTGNTPSTTVTKTRGGEPVDTALAPLSQEIVAATTVVLDTSVLMADPAAYLTYGDADVVIPLTVIDELDHNKTRLDEAGRNARAMLRVIEDLRTANDGDISTAVDLPNGGTFRIEPNGLRLDALTQHHLDATVNDHRIIAAAIGLAADGRENVTLVSNDAALRIKASLLGLNAREYRQVIGGRKRVPGGWTTIEVGSDTINTLYERRRLDIGSVTDADTSALTELKVNEFAVLRCGQQSALIRRDTDGVRLTADEERNTAWELRPKGKEQAFAIELLLDDSVPLVALEGSAGTGKTILAIAAGLQKVFEDNAYSRMTILRPVISVGKQDIGFLPGTAEEKLGPWFEAVVDTMVALSPTMTHRQARETLDDWVKAGRLTLESVTFLRGRSLQSTYVLVDEAQNLEVSTVKTIVTRLGRGSKGVLIGDTTQIDSPWTSEHSNGLSALVHAFTGTPEFGHVTLTAGQRSRIADLAADRL